MRKISAADIIGLLVLGGIYVADGYILADEMTPGEGAIDAFLSAHWQRPLQHQGDRPKEWSHLEISLSPESCGVCHVEQFRDWQGSLHAHAMGPGVLGQLIDMDPADAAGLQVCLRCHAPLAEQADEVRAHLSEDSGMPTDALYRQGVVCVACHLRNYQMFGPPGRTPSRSENNKDVPHDGWISEAAFESSRFCSSCHQFDADGYALNGKPLENTFEEWKASPQARDGKSCQSCHMPDRRHLWKGVHDKATVMSGVDMALTKISLCNRKVSARLSLTNTGTGHHFPTYVTPRVVMEGFQVDTHGEIITETLREHIIARQVSLDLSEELFDTRLAPGRKAQVDYEVSMSSRATSIVFRIRVEPDHYYREFYRALLDSDPDRKGAEFIRHALRDAETSAYTLFRQEHLLENSCQ